MVESFGNLKQPEGILENIVTHDLDNGSAAPACEQSERILPKVENMAGYHLACGSSNPARKVSEGILPKVENMAGHDVTAPVCEKSEGILQLIDKLENIVDKLLPR